MNKLFFYIKGHLKDHQKKTGKSYKQLILDMMDVKKPLHGEFTISALRLLTGKQTLIVKPFPKKTSKKGKTKDVTWEAQEVYCLENDKTRPKSEIEIFMISNGINFYAPAVERGRAELSEIVTPFKESLKECFELCNEVCGVLPQSLMKNGFGMIKKHLQAVVTIAESCNLATGSATIPDVPILPQPSATAPRKSRKRRAPSSTATQEQGDTQETQEGGGKDPLVSSRMDQFQCCCGLSFENRNDLEVHIDTHPKDSWACSFADCNKSYNSKGKVWKHYRQTHLGIFHHY